MARITRKELKSDKFALEVEHTVNFFEEHQKEIIRYGAIALAIAVLIVGYSIYSRHQRAEREAALYVAIQAQEAPVGAAAPGALSFPTQQAKDQQTTKLFTDLKNKYSGSDEADISQYYLGSILADEGKLAEAEKSYLQASQSGDAKYASLAKLALAQIYFADGRADQGEKMLRDLMDHPTIFVSKDQATITLARYLAQKKPAEARKLLQPLMSKPGPVGQTAISISGGIPQ
ncbi:MAG: tetratricopeptide repeat protein [Acidobacteriia bacterium]|nr:tetratricopeptide repeat protein [Terriglobia bacterium]